MPEQSRIPSNSVPVTSEIMSWQWYRFMFYLYTTLTSTMADFQQLKSDFEDYKSTHP